MKIEFLTVEKAEKNKEKLARFYYENVKSCSCMERFSLDDAFVKMGSLISHISDHTAIAYGAFDRHELVGFIWAYSYPFREEQRIYVNEIRVMNEYRNQGIGAELLRVIEERTKAMGIRTIYLHAEASNSEAINFYKSNGYEEERVQLKKEVLD